MQDASRYILKLTVKALPKVNIKIGFTSRKSRILQQKSCFFLFLLNCWVIFSLQALQNHSNKSRKRNDCLIELDPVTLPLKRNVNNVLDHIIFLYKAQEFYIVFVLLSLRYSQRCLN